jgi:ubiquinol-cytochrome c reductase cytochrome b subunit
VKRAPLLRRSLLWFDARLGGSSFARSALNKIFPDNWSFMLGEVALYCFLVLVLTGTYLTLFFSPSSKDVVYQGSYLPLHGVTMSEAYRSTVQLSFDVRAGLVFRQMHHWASLLFAGAVVLHLCRVFFTGAFRRPREINWLIGLTLLLLVIVNGFTGYSLPDDLLSGTGLRIAYSIALAVPVVGTWLAFLAFGGEFPSEAITSRLFVFHILLGPGLIIALLSAHLAIIWRQKHTQFPGPGRTEQNIVGSRLWPTYAARSVGLLAAVFAVIAALAGLAQINPVWLYGPFEPAAVSTAAQPDWYMGWLEGALRLFPAIRLHLLGHTLSELFWPGVALPTVTFGLLYLWPFLERRVTRDVDAHELLDRPRDRPVRTAAGAATISFYVVLFAAGSQDIIAQKVGVDIPVVVSTFRAMLFVVPPLVAALAWKLCHDLAEALPLEELVGPVPLPPTALPTGGTPASSDDGHVDRSWLVRGAVGAAGLVAGGVGYLAGRRGSRTTIVFRRDGGRRTR